MVKAAGWTILIFCLVATTAVADRPLRDRPEAEATQSQQPASPLASGPTSTSRPSLSRAEIDAAVAGASRTRGKVRWWRSRSLGVTFGYDERWEVGTPVEESTAVVVNWRSKQSGELMATVFLKSQDSSPLAKLSADEIKDNPQRIVDVVVARERRRDPPVVYIELDLQIATVLETHTLRLYVIVTAWNGREILFACSSHIPRDMPELTPMLDAVAKKMLSGLQFAQ
jgi:hypothetical protein